MADREIGAKLYREIDAELVRRAEDVVRRAMGVDWLGWLAASRVDVDPRAIVAEIAVELEAVEERVRFLRRAGRAWKEEATRLRSRAVGMGEWGGKGWRDRYEYEEPAAHWEPDAERVAEALRDPEPARIVNPEDAVGTIGVIGTWEGVVLLGPGWKERGDGA